MSESNNNASSGTIAGMVLVIALAIAIPFVIKHYLMPQYIEAWYWFKYYLIKPIHWLATLKFIAAHFDSFFFWVDWMFIDMNIPKGQLVQIISDTKSMLDSVDDTSKRALYLRFTDVDDTLNSDFKNSSRLIYAIYSPVYLFICAMLVVKILRKDHYDTTYSLDSFVKKMSKGFPEILPVAYDNPQHERDLDIGKWRSSPKAYDYLNNLNCLKMIDKSGRDFFSLDIDKVRELLVEQLGSKWTGF